MELRRHTNARTTDVILRFFCRFPVKPWKDMIKNLIEWAGVSITLLLRGIEYKTLILTKTVF